jgi:hypothetical protein
MSRITVSILLTLLSLHFTPSSYAAELRDSKGSARALLKVIDVNGQSTIQFQRGDVKLVSTSMSLQSVAESLFVTAKNGKVNLEIGEIRISATSLELEFPEQEFRVTPAAVPHVTSSASGVECLHVSLVNAANEPAIELRRGKSVTLSAELSVRFGNKSVPIVESAKSLKLTIDSIRVFVKDCEFESKSSQVSLTALGLRDYRIR